MGEIAGPSFYVLNIQLLPVSHSTVTDLTLPFILVGFIVICGAFCYDVVLDERLDEWMPTKVSTVFGILILESLPFIVRMIPILLNDTACWEYLI